MADDYVYHAIVSKYFEVIRYNAVDDVKCLFEQIDRTIIKQLKSMTAINTADPYNRLLYESKIVTESRSEGCSPIRYNFNDSLWICKGHSDTFEEAIIDDELIEVAIHEKYTSLSYLSCDDDDHAIVDYLIEISDAEFKQLLDIAMVEYRNENHTVECTN